MYARLKRRPHLCEKASRHHSNLLSATQATMEGDKQRGGNAHRRERCPRGSPLPSYADNTTFDMSITTILFYPEVPDYTAPLPSHVMLLRSTKCGYIEPTPMRAHYSSSAISFDLRALRDVAPRTRSVCRPSTRALCGSRRRVDDSLRTIILHPIRKSRSVSPPRCDPRTF
jgi:hypothetical protein